jgi:hypothetical protein
MLQCIICRFNVLVQIFTLHKRLIKYSKVNGIIPMTIHVQIAHSKLFTLKKQQLNEVAKLVHVHVQQPRKKSPHVLITMRLLVFGCHKLIQKKQ